MKDFKWIGRTAIALLLSLSFGMIFAQTQVQAQFDQTGDQIEDENKRVPPTTEPNGISCAQANANNGQYPNIVLNASLAFSGTPPANAAVSTMFITNGPWTWYGPAGDNVSEFVMQGSRQHGSYLVNALGFIIHGPKTATAVIVTGTSGSANIYAYQTEGVSDDGPLEAPNFEKITKVEVCVNPSGTLAADVSLSGRVVTPKQEALPRAKITIQNAATGDIVIVNSNVFGYFTADGLDGGWYYVTITHKDWQFTNRTINLDNAVDDAVFMAKRQKTWR